MKYSYSRFPKKDPNNNVKSPKLDYLKYPAPSLKEIGFKRFKSGDILEVSDLSQLGDSVRDIMNIIVPLLRKKVNINILNLGLLDDSTQGYWILKTFLVVARQERNTEHMKKAYKNHTGNKGGRPRRVINQQYKEAVNFFNQGHSYKEAKQKFGISKSTLYRVRKQLKQ